METTHQADQAKAAALGCAAAHGATVASARDWWREASRLAGIALPPGARPSTEECYRVLESADAVRYLQRKLAECIARLADRHGTAKQTVDQVEPVIIEALAASATPPTTCPTSPTWHGYAVALVSDLLVESRLLLVTLGRSNCTDGDALRREILAMGRVEAGTFVRDTMTALGWSAWQADGWAGQDYRAVELDVQREWGAARAYLRERQPAPPDDGAVVEPAGVKRSTKKHRVTINARIIDLLQQHPEASGWSARRIASHLKCGKSTVAESSTYRVLEVERSKARAERAKTQRRNRKPLSEPDKTR